MALDFKELKQRMASGKVATTSTLKLRDERIQKKDFGKRFKKLTLDKKTKTKLLFLTDLSFPFNPFTGVEDESYNRDSNYRPEIYADDTLKLIKNACSEDENLKKFYMDYVGVENWDTSDCLVVTKEDKAIFNPFRHPRLFTLPVVGISLPAVTGNEWTTNYLIEVVKDQLTNEIVGEMPLPLKINKFQSAVAYEKVINLEDRIAKGEVSYNKEDLSTEKKKIFRDTVAVSSDYPINFALALKFELDGEFNIVDKLSQINLDNIADYVVIAKCSKEINNTLDKFMDGDYKAFDINNSFLECDRTVPDEDDDATRGRATRYEKASTKITEVKAYDNLANILSEYLGQEDLNLERIFMNSAKVRKYNDTMTSQLLDACADFLPIDNPFITDKVLQANNEIVNLIYGDKLDAIYLQSSMGQLPEGKLDEKAAKELSKENNVSVSSIDIEDLEIES